MAEAAQQLNGKWRNYVALPTIERFHRCPAQFRCIVGPVGSGKTSGAAMEVGYYIGAYMLETYGITRTKGVIVRNTYRELVDTTMRTFMEDWIDWGEYKKADETYIYKAQLDGQEFEVEVLFRACDKPGDVKKFKSLEITWFWEDESIEIPHDVKLMLKTRLGRYPQKVPAKFGIETTNPPDVEHPIYWEYDWDTPPPGPKPEKEPLAKHVGFWQPPGENNANLRIGYYDDLRNEFRDQPDWIDMYIEGKPGLIEQGKLVYNNYVRAVHESREPLIWSGGKIFRGWDNSGNCPAATIVQEPTTRSFQVMREFTTDKMNIVDFAEWVKIECNKDYPGADYMDLADPAGENKYSTRDRQFTSNAELMRTECEINPIASEQALGARISAVEKSLARRDGLLIDPRCVRLINGFMGGYHYSEIGTSGVYREEPDKNRFSHVHESLQYILAYLDRGGNPNERPRRPNRMKRAQSTSLGPRLYRH